ncbi:MAG: SlyX family protein [Gammaproteobacteria bacterium]|nr:SlyX family protein [Gammaproteobacteria bacterium]MCP4982358.1 SlyX family protein [Gammaproteobacteria bacterium]
MNESLQAKLDRLEMLYTEQEYTLHALNDTVARQNQEISALQASIEQLKNQLQTMKTELPQDNDSRFEKPPHY